MNSGFLCFVVGMVKIDFINGVSVIVIGLVEFEVVSVMKMWFYFGVLFVNIFEIVYGFEVFIEVV